MSANEEITREDVQLNFTKLWPPRSEGLNWFCAFRLFISLLGPVRGIFYTCLHESQYFIPLFGPAQAASKKQTEENKRQ